jgi:predicted transglutaminase-like cysteine proteinase
MLFNPILYLEELKYTFKQLLFYMRTFKKLIDIMRAISRIIAVGSVAMAIGFMLVGPELAQAAKASPSFFRSKEIRSSNLKPFKKWTGALGRYVKERSKIKGDCKATKLNKCHYAAWVKFLTSIKKKDPVTQIRLVNKYMNQAKYTTDKANWGKKDFWATPGEFMSKFGDCEDFAISKFLSLRMLGFKQNQLRVVAVKDLNLKVGHAVLVVYHGGKVLVLDNQIKKVIEASRIRHYTPVFSINDKFWWRHRT